jgi:LPS-assembly protein
VAKSLHQFHPVTAALTCAAVLLVSQPVTAQSADVCSIFPEDAPELVVTPSETIEIRSGKAEIDIEGDAVFTDRLQLRSGSRSLAANEARYRSEARTFSVAGDVEYRDPDARVSGDEARFDAQTMQVQFSGAAFELRPAPARGEAGEITIDDGQTLLLRDVRYTSCAADDEDWALSARRIDIDRTTGVGEARDVKLRFMDVPIFYTPYLSFPVDDMRKSGWLLPDLGNTDRTGFDFSFPYYFNLAPNYDLTLTPRVTTRRGLQLGAEFRYLTERHSGTASAEYLPDDDLTSTNRAYIAIDHQTMLRKGWRATLNAETVSDNQYFEDLRRSLSDVSRTHLNRELALDYSGRHWVIDARLQDYQTIDSFIGPSDEPYKRLPQIAARGTWQDGVLGLDYTFDSELAVFDRSTGITGSRLHLKPEISAPLRFSGIGITPTVALEHTRYQLSGTALGEVDDPDRTTPIASIDLDAVFERKAGSRGQWFQTLEPRVQFVHIPFRNQDDIPVFDTIEPDFNFVQLFRPNRFLGYDRLGDTDQLSFGVTSRLVDAEDGRQYLTATIGQTRYLSNRDVVLPDGTRQNENSSDYIAEVGINIYENWNLDLGYQWNSDTRTTSKAEARIQWRPERSKILNLAYRFRSNSVEQTDVSFSWPVADNWNVVGRFNYSLREDITLERFLGVEYQTCCWGLRLVTRRHISRNTGEADTSVSIQLILKGLTNIGDPADRLLEHGILGYQRD